MAVNAGGYELRRGQYVHRLKAERALGKPLPRGAVVHHVDYNRLNNDNTNLVVCPDRRYHSLLHQRQDAVNAGYPAHYRQCDYCKQFDDPDNMRSYMRKSGPGMPHHIECNAQACREYKIRRKQSAIT